MKLNKPCPYCSRPLTQDVIDRKKKTHSENIKAALALAKSRGEPIGRPRETDYKKIVELRKRGMSTRVISQTLKVSLGSVQRAIKGPP